MNRDPSMDELMWLIAEENNPAAIEAFGRRNPEQHPELLRRVRVVQAMKSGRPQSSPSAVPTFTPKANVQPIVHKKVWAPYAMAAALVTVGFASYLGTQKLAAKQPAVAAAEYATKDQNSAMGAESTNAIPPGAAQSKIEEPKPEVIPAVPVQDQELWARRVALQGEDLHLYEIFNEIQGQTGLTITVPPGVDNPVVTVQYQGWRAIDVLKELGRRLGFTAFEQGDNEVLIIPAVDTEPTDTKPAISPDYDPAP